MSNALTVANELLWKTAYRGHPRTARQLQLDLYLLQVMALLETQSSLIQGERFCKTPLGPQLLTVQQIYPSTRTTVLLQPQLKDRQQQVIPPLDFIPQLFMGTHLAAILPYSVLQLQTYFQQEPQSQNLASRYYSDVQAYNFYKDPEHRFWEKH